MAIALEDAYEVLHRAILALGPERKPSNCLGENTLIAARHALYTLQTALVFQLELMDPDNPLKIDRSSDRIVTLSVPMTPEHLEAIKRHGKAIGEETPEMTASRIIVTWLDENDEG